MLNKTTKTTKSIKTGKEEFGIVGREDIKEAFLLAKRLTPSDIRRQRIVSPDGKIYQTHLDKEAKEELRISGSLAAIISFQTRQLPTRQGIVLLARVAEIRKFKPSNKINSIGV